MSDQHLRHRQKQAAEAKADNFVWLTVLSLRLEAETGYDSIPTIAEHYAGVCVMPECRFRGSPQKLWRHVHFGTKHPLSFGVRWKDVETL